MKRALIDDEDGGQLSVEVTFLSVLVVAMLTFMVNVGGTMWAALSMQAVTFNGAVLASDTGVADGTAVATYTPGGTPLSAVDYLNNSAATTMFVRTTENARCALANGSTLEAGRIIRCAVDWAPVFFDGPFTGPNGFAVLRMTSSAEALTRTGANASVQ